MKWLTAQCPECDNEWTVTEEQIKQPVRGAIVTITCPKCRQSFRAAGMKANGFIFENSDEART
jgi:predicted Zn finger-like uncharacterized protein